MVEPKKSSRRGVLILALTVLLVLLVGWYVFFPLLGVAVVLTTLVWAVILASVTLLAIGIALFYVLAGTGILAVCILGIIWFVGSLIIFPFLFPLLLPLLMLMLFIAYVRRRENRE